MLALLLACAAPAAPPMTTPPAQVDNIAHRGGAALGPEETLPTMRASLEAGADVLELDVRATADGEIVCMHDETVDRTTDGEGAVSSMSLAALKALDAGYHFTPDGQRFPFRGAGVTAPTLREVLAAFPGQRFILELKQTEPPIIAPVLALLREHDAVENTVIAAFSADVLREVREAEPSALTGFGMSEVVSYRLLGGPDAPPARYLQVPPRVPGLEVVTPALLERARSQGVAVQVWTINDPEEMRAMIALGVAGIMTDDPATLSALLAAQ